MDHLKNILDGIASAFLFGVEQRPYIVNRHGFWQDAVNLRQDAKRVGQTLGRVLDRHGKQVGQSAG